MADTKKNALAELAVRLGTDVLSLGRAKYPEIEKASRIVSELAKVEDVYDLYRLQLVRRPNQDQALAAIVKCRSIAEEGAKDETK